MTAMPPNASHALRALRRSPWTSLGIVLTLALAVGVNTSVFSVVYGVLIRPLPYPHPERLVRLWLHNPRQGIDKDITSYPDFLAWREGGRSFERIVAVRTPTLNLTGVGEPEELRGAAVTEGYFPMLGVAPALGRTFTAEEESPDGAPAVVLSHELWATRFGGDRGVVGRQIRLGGEPYTIVGVMSPGLGEPAFWVPLQFRGAYRSLRDQRGALWLPVFGRLRPGVSLAQAQAEMSGVAKRLEAQFPEANAGMGILLEPLRDSIVGDVRPALLVLLGSVALVLLIACANVANILLARGTARRRELAVRAALGAGRARLMRQVMTESLALALAGGALGVLLATWGVRVLVAFAPASLPRTGDVRLDGAVLAFSLVVTLAAGLLFGAMPAWDAGRRDPGEALQAGGRGGIGGAADRLRPVLIGGQFALAVLLLVGAGLMLRSFERLQRVDPGFDPKGLLAVELDLPSQKYDTGAKSRAFFQELLTGLRSMPGVKGADAISALFLSRLPQSAPVVLEGRPDLPTGIRNAPVAYDAASTGLVRTLRLRLLRGRDLEPGDDGDAPAVALVNEAFVRRYFPGEDPVGRRFSLGGPARSESDWIRIVGVLADDRRSGLAEDPRPAALLPMQQYTGRMTVLVRTSGDPLGVVPLLRAAVRRVDPEQPLGSVRAVDDLLAETVAARRFVMLLLAVFAGAATVLAAVGIYGVVAFMVGRRTREIGVRMALGAQRRQVLGLVVAGAMRQAGLGMLLGSAAALALGGVIRGQLFGVQATDPPTFLAVLALLGGLALLASWLPARRAARIDPLVALRTD
ncbi:MAG TPA: ABC transporter permease [Longimicrobiales bacterium]|nr:ABC transporter permease [Longimicrobiales bacterium]